MWFYYAAVAPELTCEENKKDVKQIKPLSAMTALWEDGHPWVHPWDIFAPLPQDFSAFRPRDIGENGRTLQSGCTFMLTLVVPV
jgi:hypothetical protein